MQTAVANKPSTNDLNESTSTGTSRPSSALAELQKVENKVEELLALSGKEHFAKDLAMLVEKQDKLKKELQELAEKQFAASTNSTAAKRQASLYHPENGADVEKKNKEQAQNSNANQGGGLAEKSDLLQLSAALKNAELTISTYGTLDYNTKTTLLALVRNVTKDYKTETYGERTDLSSNRTASRDVNEDRFKNRPQLSSADELERKQAA